MEISTLIRKGVLSEQEGYYLLSEYIWIRKGVKVRPKLMFNPFDPTSEVVKFHDLLNHAIAWFKENEY